MSVARNGSLRLALSAQRSKHSCMQSDWIDSQRNQKAGRKPGFLGIDLGGFKSIFIRQ
jgi:hypothetical protein